MNFDKICGKFKSTNGSDSIAYYVYKPASKPAAAVQIVHGMCEYLERYEEFIGFLCANGILVFGHDHLGHGKSVASEEYLGYFARERGWQYLAKDTVKLTKIMRKQYEDIPFYIMGHSMGSLAVRAVLAKHSDLYAGAILLGTLNMRTVTDAGMLLTGSLGRLRGDMYRTALFDALFFGRNNMKIENPASEYSWLSRDSEVVEKYENDPLCTFHFTASAYTDLLMLLDYVSRKDWADKIEDDLPVLICGGSEDPVGNYGKGPETVFNSLNDSGKTDIELKLYSGARHEVLNETNRAEVYEDLLEWLNAHILEQRG